MGTDIFVILFIIFMNIIHTPCVCVCVSMQIVNWFVYLLFVAQVILDNVFTLSLFIGNTMKLNG